MTQSLLVNTIHILAVPSGMRTFGNTPRVEHFADESECFGYMRGLTGQTFDDVEDLETHLRSQESDKDIFVITDQGEVDDLLDEYREDGFVLNILNRIKSQLANAAQD